MDHTRKQHLKTSPKSGLESLPGSLITASVSGLLLGVMVLLLATGAAKGKSSPKIEITKTTPAYAEEVNTLEGFEITIEFNQPMDPTMEEDVLLDQRGATDEDGNPIEILRKISWPNPRTMKISVSETLKPQSTYQVSLFSLRSASGEESDQVPFRTVFTTGTGK